MTRASKSQRCEAALIGALVSAGSHREAAAAVGLSEATVKRRLADPAFRERLDDARTEMLRDALNALAGHAVAALDALRSIVDDRSAPPAARVAACRDLLDRAGVVRHQQVEVIEQGPAVDPAEVQRFEWAVQLLEEGLELPDGQYLSPEDLVRRYKFPQSALAFVASTRELDAATLPRALTATTPLALSGG